jgi:hypothetical protein
MTTILIISAAVLFALFAGVIYACYKNSASNEYLNNDPNI